MRTECGVSAEFTVTVRNNQSENRMCGVSSEFPITVSNNQSENRMWRVGRVPNHSEQQPE